MTRARLASLGLAIAVTQLARHPLRTALTQLGLAVGVATLTASLCLVEGSRTSWAPEAHEGSQVQLYLSLRWIPGVSAELPPRGQALSRLPAALAEQFRGEGESGDAGARHLALLPHDPHDRALGEAIATWFLEQDIVCSWAYYDPNQVNREALGHIARLAALMYAVGGLTFLAGAVGLFGILRTAAEQRRVEFALRQVEGATPTSLAFQLGWEALLTIAGGAAVGLGSGLLVAHALVDFVPGAQFGLPVAHLAVGVGLLCALGLALGLSPLWGLSRTPPAVALREG